MYYDTGDVDDLMGHIRELMVEKQRLKDRLSEFEGSGSKADLGKVIKAMNRMDHENLQLADEVLQLKASLGSYRKAAANAQELSEVNDWLRVDLQKAEIEIGELKSKIRRLEYGNQERTISDRDIEREGRPDTSALGRRIVRWSREFWYGR